MKFYPVYKIVRIIGNLKIFSRVEQSWKKKNNLRFTTLKKKKKDSKVRIATHILGEKIQNTCSNNSDNDHDNDNYNDNDNDSDNDNNNDNDNDYHHHLHHYHHNNSNNNTLHCACPIPGQV